MTGLVFIILAAVIVPVGLLYIFDEIADFVMSAFDGILNG